MISCRPLRHPLLSLLPLLLAPSLLAQQASGDWAVPNAALRVDVAITQTADHPDLGVIVKVPNGGLLPGKFHLPDARDAQGAPLECVIVADSLSDGFAVCFAAPSEGNRASIYITPSSSAPPKPANTRLFPSTIFFTKNGNASLDVAKRMMRDYPPAQGASFDLWSFGIGSMVNPFGPDDDFSTWIVSAILLEKRERIYFCTISDEGSEFAIDGKTIHSWPGLHTRHAGAKGQRGDWVTLEPGVHRIDYFHFEKHGPQEINLCWKRPGMVTKDDLPEHVTELARSGVATIRAITFKDGRRAGVIQGNNDRLGYFWLDEKPLVRFALSYSAVEAGAGQAVYWEMPPNKRTSEPVLDWLVSGDPDLISYPVTLAVSNAAGIARTTVNMRCFWTPPALSLDTAEDRLTMRRALYGMIRAVPAPHDPCADWSNDHWSLLEELLEPYRAGPILMEIFNRGFDTLQKRPPAQRWALEDRFVETLRLLRNDKQLLDWIGRLEKSEKNNARKFRWKDERICALLFDIGDTDKARHEMAFVKESAIGQDQTQIAALRAGDLERAVGNTDAALKFYQEAQERYRSSNKIGVAGGRLSYVGARKKREDTNTVTRASGRRAGLQSLSSRQKIDDWKVYTVHDASMHATIMSFLQQDAMPEAFQKLSDWESESPTSKLSGEYPMAEARVYMAVEDYRRAINALAAYRKNVTMSAQLADAMKLEIDCRRRVNDLASIKEIARDFLKRFPGHPFEAEMKEIAEHE